MGVPETCSQRDNQFERAGNAQNDADPVTVVGAVGAITGVFQCLTGCHQSQQLRAVNRFQGCRRDIVFHRVERNV